MRKYWPEKFGCKDENGNHRRLLNKSSLAASIASLMNKSLHNFHRVVNSQSNCDAPSFAVYKHFPFFYILHWKTRSVVNAASVFLFFELLFSY